MAEVGRIGLGPVPGTDGEIEIVLVDHDPLSTVTDAVTGSLIIRADTGEHFRKLDDGSTTNVTNPINLKNNLSATVNPTVNDDNTLNYTIGSLWVNTTDDTAFVCTDASTGAAVWRETTNEGGGTTLGEVWRFDTATADADPGNGKFRFDNATQGSATQIFIDNLTDGGLDVAALLLKLNTDDRIFIQERNDGARSHSIRVIGQVTDGGGYVKIPIAVEGSGANPLRNNRQCVFLFHFSAGGATAEVFSGYDATGGTELGSGVGGNPTAFVPLPLDAEHTKTSGFTHSTTVLPAEVTINKAGTYVISGSVGNNVTSGTNRSESEGRLMLDTGGGFVEVGGTRIENYNRTLVAGGNDGSFEVILGLAVGDVLRMEGRRLVGDNTVVQKADGTSLAIFEPGSDGAQGPPGELGNFQFFAGALDLPNNVNWAVNALAPAVVRPSPNQDLTVRRFPPSVKTGIGILVEVPAGAINITLRTRAFSQDGSAGTVELDFNKKGLPDNAAVESWLETALSDRVLPANAFLQYDSETVTLASLGLVAGRSYNMELVRDGLAAGDNLGTGWDLFLFKLDFT